MIGVVAGALACMAVTSAMGADPAPADPGRDIAQSVAARAVAATSVQPIASDSGLVYKHGYAFLAEPKYPPDFPHFDYVDPDAPKAGGCVFRRWESWDNFNPLSVPGGQMAAGFTSRIRAQSAARLADGEVGRRAVDDLRPAGRGHCGGGRSARTSRSRYATARAGTTASRSRSRTVAFPSRSSPPSPRRPWHAAEAHRVVRGRRSARDSVRHPRERHAAIRCCRCALA